MVRPERTGEAVRLINALGIIGMAVAIILLAVMALVIAGVIPT